MKKLILLFVAASFLCNAQTSITSPSVSGVWNLAGSPYIINQNIQVPSTQTLVINPGVVVKFMPSTRLTVNGRLISSGTAALPITYEAVDTTSWHNLNVPTGGWEGILFQLYMGTGTDNSIFDWCVVKDVKNKSMFECYRKLKIHNSKFTHGKYSASQQAISLGTMSALDSIDFNNNEIGNHSFLNLNGYVIINGNQQGGYTKISNSIIRDNRGITLWSTLSNIKIENNEFYNNIMSGQAGVIVCIQGKAIINKNHIHNNTTDYYPAIAANGGKMTIDNNFIHNNNSTQTGICGSNSGGSGIHLSSGMIQTDSTMYLVRNNIVVNNYRHTGAPIFMFNGRAIISNNHVINNEYANNNSSMVDVFGSFAKVVLKNNLFYSKSTSGIVDSLLVLRLYGASFKVENNYLPARFFKSVYVSLSNLTGDTTQNVIGILPQMISPTANNSYTTNAASANFNLFATSPCINKGDTAGCKTLLFDYLGNNRISGIIDIGAFEKIDVQTGINEFNKNEQSLLVYPNPANDKIMVHSAQGVLNEVSIIDLLGKEQLLIKSKEMQTEIDITALKAGVYFVSVIKNGNSITQKLIINK